MTTLRLAQDIPTLSIANLHLIDNKVAKPNPSRDLRQEPIRIVHIGATSRFASSFMFSIVDDYNNASPDNAMGVSAVSIRRPEKEEQFRAAADLRAEQARQDGMYTLLQKSNNVVIPRVVASVQEYVAAYENPDLVRARLASRDVTVVSLTITPGSYKVNLDESIDAPETWIGYLLRAMLDRREQGIPLPTILSCDNVKNNGELAKRCILALAERQCHPDIVEWLRENIKAPNTMVDRITPETTVADRQYVNTVLGYADVAPTVCETFRQFVISNDVGPNFPALHTVPGVQMTDDVEKFERTKLWALNGSHRAIAYIGFLIGTQMVSDAFAPIIQDGKNMGTPMLGRFIGGLMDEFESAVPDIAGVDKDAYINSLLRRFSDASLGDQVARVGKDGSEKVAGRLLDPIRVQLEKGGNIDYLAFAVAAWIRYLTGIHNNSTLFDINDNKAERNGLQEAARAIKRQYEDTKEETGRGDIDLSFLFQLPESIFGHDLQRDSRFTIAVTAALKSIYDLGMEGALKQMMPQSKSNILPREEVTINGLTLAKIMGQKTRVA